MQPHSGSSTIMSLLWKLPGLPGSWGVFILSWDNDILMLHESVEERGRAPPLPRCHPLSSVFAAAVKWLIVSLWIFFGEKNILKNDHYNILIIMIIFWKLIILIENIMLVGLFVVWHGMVYKGIFLKCVTRGEKVTPNSYHLWCIPCLGHECKCDVLTTQSQKPAVIGKQGLNVYCKRR